MSEQALKQLLGPRVVNLGELEKTYYEQEVEAVEGSL
jgi:hypothetical protein